ncbi:MAG: hypothetical protein H7Y00_03370 [Fimbriimonadaceae bacterium]|nr:hypothetical protein [Chitinophagales bacterium]
MNLKDMFEKRFNNPSSKGDEFGFTNRYEKGTKRIIDKNGGFNVIRIGEKKQIFHEMLTMKWWRFAMYILLFYLFVNLFFAIIYLLIDFNGIGMTIDYEVHNNFLIAFFFSAQTLTTVGYGSLYPLSAIVSFVAASEAVVGLMGFAIFTGLMYGRFSKSPAGIRFSQHSMIGPYKQVNGLMFRAANERNNNLTELEVRALMAVVINDNGKETRRYQQLNIDNNKITYFPLNWTMVHPIDELSPLWGMSEQDFKDGDIEILVMIKGYNETSSQEVHARFSYTYDEIIWGSKFKLPYYFREDGTTIFEIDKLDDYEKIS